MRASDFDNLRKSAIVAEMRSFLSARSIMLSANHRLHLPRRVAQWSTIARNIPHPGHAESNVICDEDGGGVICDEDGGGDMSLSGGVCVASKLLTVARFCRECLTI